MSDPKLFVIEDNWQTTIEDIGITKGDNGVQLIVVIEDDQSVIDTVRQQLMS